MSANDRINEAMEIPIAEVRARLTEFEVTDPFYRHLCELEGDPARLLLALLEKRRSEIEVKIGKLPRNFSALKFKRD